MSIDKELRNEILKFAVIRTFQRGEVIIKTGDEIYSSFLIISGLIEIIHKEAEGKESFQYYLQPGQACAVTAVLKEEKDCILAVASRETKVIAILFEFRDKITFKHRHWYSFT